MGRPLWMRSPLVAIAGLLALVLTPLIGDWLVRPKLQTGFEEALLERLAVEGFGSVTVDVDDFAVTLSGQLEHEGQRARVLGLVDEIFPLYLAADGDCLVFPVQLKPLQRGGRIRFNDSRVSPAQFERLRSWVRSLRSDLEPRFEWRTVEVSTAAKGELGIPADGGRPALETPAAALWPILAEPAVLVAVREENEFLLLGVLPDESWLQALERALPADLAHRRVEGPQSLRLGPQAEIRGFRQPDPDLVGALLADLLADEDTESVVWRGGIGGRIDWYRRELPEQELARWQARAASISNLPPHRALVVVPVED